MRDHDELAARFPELYDEPKGSARPLIVMTIVIGAVFIYALRGVFC